MNVRALPQRPARTARSGVAGAPSQAACGVEDGSSPVVYGSPWQIAVMPDSVARLLELEPTEVFADQAVRHFGSQLSRVIRRRVDEASRSNADGQPVADTGDAP